MAKRVRVPARDKGVYQALSDRFRDGRLYAFSWDGNVWETWQSEADWNATERNGTVRDPVAAAAGHGPTVWDRDQLTAWLGVDAPARVTRSQRPAKSELVGMLRRILEGTDWSVSELSDLVARSV